MRRAPPRCITLALATAAAMAILGCGREYVDLGAASSSDGSPTTDGSLARTDAPCVSTVTMGASCSGSGVPCNNSRSTCCSGRCEPLGGDGTPMCLANCAPDKAPCMSAQDCCSLACNVGTNDPGGANGGTCGGALCKTTDTMCNTDTDCCSNHCTPNSSGHVSRCTIDQSESCLPTGEGCDPEAGPPHCCSGVCDGATGRCDFGRGPCLDPGSPCEEGDATCCAGLNACALNSEGVLTCASSCLGDGTHCNFDSECCGGTCTGSPQQVCSSVPACE